MSKNNAVSNFDKSLKEERSEGPQEGKGAVMFNSGNNGNGNRNNRDFDRKNGNDRNGKADSAPAPAVTLKRNLPESAENSQMLSQFRESMIDAVPKYVDTIDRRIAEVEEELKALRQEKNVLMNLNDSIRVFE